MPDRSHPRPRPPGLDRPWVTPIVKWMSRANTWLYRRTNGRFGGTWRVMAGFRKPAPVLLLTVTGRKSGKPHTVPLIHVEDGDGVVVVASSGGLPNHPQWYRNLLVNPEVEVQVGDEIRAMTATEVNADEKARLWPLVNDVYADFDTYDAWTDREIPVIRLTPR